MNYLLSTSISARVPFVSLALLAIQFAAAHASLVGDLVHVDRINAEASGGPFSYCRDVLGSGPHGCPVTVAEGDSDRLALTGGNNLYVNVEAFQIRFELGPEFGGGGPFDEHLVVFRDLNFLGTNHVVSGVTFETDLIGMDASRITFSNYGLAVNYANITYPGGQYLILNLQTSPIPEASTFALAALGAIGLVSARRRQNSRQPGKR